MEGLHEIKRYWKDGKVIEALVSEETHYFLIMEINTPQGSMVQRPKIEAASIEEAYEKVPVTEQMVMDQVKAAMIQPKIIQPGARF